MHDETESNQPKKKLILFNTLRFWQLSTFIILALLVISEMSSQYIEHSMKQTLSLAYAELDSYHKATNSQDSSQNSSEYIPGEKLSENVPIQRDDIDEIVANAKNDSNKNNIHKGMDKGFPVKTASGKFFVMFSNNKGYTVDCMTQDIEHCQGMSLESIKRGLEYTGYKLDNMNVNGFGTVYSYLKDSVAIYVVLDEKDPQTVLSVIYDPTGENAQRIAYARLLGEKNPLLLQNKDGILELPFTEIGSTGFAITSKNWIDNDSAGGGCGAYLKQINGVWKEIMCIQDIPECKTINQYKVPQTIIKQCTNASGDAIDNTN